MPLFPSAQWIDAFCEQLEAHPRASEAAASLGGVYRFVVEPSGPLAARHTYEVVLVGADDGASAWRVEGSPAARVTVRTDYNRWRQLLLGTLDLGPAMLFGRIRITGDLPALLNARDDVDVVVDALRRVDTQWMTETRTDDR